MRRMVWALVGIVALVMAGAACGDDDDAPTPDEAATTTEAVQGESPGDEAPDGDGDDAEPPPTTEAAGAIRPFSELTASMQDVVSSICERASNWGSGSSWGDITPNVLRAGEAGPDLEPFGQRIADTTDAGELAEIAAEMADTCELIGWPGS